MPRNGSGTYSRVSPPGSGGYTAGTVIDPSHVNGEVNDIATELTNSIDKGGRTTPTANLPMGGFRHTGVGNGSARNDYASVAQLQDGGPIIGTTAGTSTAYTLTLSPAITAYADGQMFRVKFHAENTTTNPTLAINGLAATTIKRYCGGGAQDIEIGDLSANAWYNVFYSSSASAFVIIPYGVKALALINSSGTLVFGFNCTTGRDSLGHFWIELATGKAYSFQVQVHDQEPLVATLGVLTPGLPGGNPLPHEIGEITVIDPVASTVGSLVYQDPSFISVVAF